MFRLLTVFFVGWAALRFAVFPKLAIALDPDAAQRGREADSPVEMPAKGWKDILWRCWEEIQDDRLFSVAAEVAFYALLATVPLLSVFMSIYGLLSDVSSVSDQLAPFLRLLPDVARDLVLEQARWLAAQPPKDLSINLLIGVLLAGWSANAAMKSMFEALNVIYDEREKRSFFKLNLISLGLTFGVSIVLVASLILVAALSTRIVSYGWESSLQSFMPLLAAPVFLLGLVALLLILYRLGPSRRPPKFRWLWPGAVLAATGWMGVSALFSWYAASWGDYSAAYGSLAAVVVFMTWLWLSAALILIGAEFNAELEHQTVRDTTIGQPKPMGVRGASMADTVGEAKA